MREIIFKAKRKNWKELPKEQWWIEGDLVKKLCGRYTTFGFEEFGAYIIVENFSDGGTIYAYIDESTICQYTGLTDKNGQKIWEHDIVRRTDLHLTEQPSVGIIDYDVENTAFVIHWIDVVNYSPTYPWKDKIEVIGNVFDNPELLTGDVE